MDFKRARNEEQIANRQAEIINACRNLYTSEHYDNITFGKISNMTSISRPSIYNYYNTREEILLDVLEKEYLKLYEILKSEFDENIRMGKKEFCNFIVNSFKKCDVLLKLMSIQYSIIEKNCSFEKLAHFKTTIQPVFKLLDNLVSKVFPRLNSSERNNFIFLMLSSISSIYEMTNPTEKQAKVMKIANREYKTPQFEEFCYQYLWTLSLKI